MITADTKKKSAKKQTTAIIGAVGINNRIGETGVNLRFHTRSEYDLLSGVQRAELNNWRHSSAGKRSTTGYPKGGGRGCYVGCGGRYGRGRGCGGHGKGRGQGGGKFESQVAAIIAKTDKNEANKLTNALKTVASASSAVNGSFSGILPPIPPDARNIAVSAADARKQQVTEFESDC